MFDLARRLDRLPVTSAHRMVIATLAFAYFFELADLNTFAYAAPGVVAQWHVSLSVVALITAASFGGMFLGATLGGWLADLYGRRRAFILAIALYTAGSLLNALSWDVASLSGFRLLTGFGLSAMTVIANTYISELFPARVRGRFMGLVMTVGLIGIPVTAWVARFVVPAAPWGWRLVFVWGSFGLLALPMAFRLRESPRWLLNSGRLPEAEAVVAELERIAVRQFGALPPLAAIPDAPAMQLGERTSFLRLFSPQYRTRTIALLLTWTLNTLGFYGFIAWVPTLLVQQGFTIVKSLNYASLIAICNPVGALVAMAVIERLERKHFVALFSCAVAAVVLAYGLVSSPVMIVVFGALVVIGIQACTVALYTYTPEIYPTEIRSSGMGLAYGAGRLANVAGPFVVSTLYMAAGYTSVFVYIAVCYVGGGLMVMLFGPMATGRVLEVLAAHRAPQAGPAPAGVANRQPS